MKIKLKKELVDLLIYVIILFVFGIWFLNVYKEQKMDLCSEALILFTEAMQKDIKQNVDRQMGYYDLNLSPNLIPRDEKKKWLDQSYITICDSSRHVWDSIYHAILKENDIRVKSAIRYIKEGNVIHTSDDSTIYKDVNLLPPIVYRIDDNIEKNITLQAYVDISFCTILSRMGGFLLLWILFLILAGAGAWYSQRMMNYAKLRMSKLSNLLKIARKDSIKKAGEIKQKETELIELLETASKKLQQAKLINQEKEELIEQKETELMKLKEEALNELQQAQSVNREKEKLIKQKEAELVKLKEDTFNELQQARVINLEQAELIKQKEAEITQLKNEMISLNTTKKTTWRYLPCDLKFNEKSRELRYKDQQSVVLTENSSKLFGCFIRSEGYEMTYEDICIEVMARSVKDGRTHSDSAAASASIRRLKDQLAPFPFIKFISIRGIGYKMILSDSENDITEQGNDLL